MTPVFVDPRLLGAIQEAVGFPNVPYDLKKVKALTNFLPASLWERAASSRDWLRVRKGDFSLLARMDNLHTVLFPEYGGIQAADFSFLPQCRKLKKLDLAGTNFSDCALLEGMPALRWVRLPHRAQLVHLEALDRLAERGVTVEVTQRLTEPRPAPPPEPDGAPCAEYGGAPSDGRGARLARAVIRLTQKPAYALLPRPDRTPAIDGTKLGGLPYWDGSRPYPAAKNGRPMKLLSQINFAQGPWEDPLPQRGILQFFLPWDSEVYGMGCGVAADFAVVYHEAPGPCLPEEALLALAGDGQETDADDAFWPLLCPELALDVERRPCWMNTGDRGFPAVFCQAVQEEYGETADPEQWWSFLDNEDDEEALVEALDRSVGCNGGHWMLGWPSFTQGDPRAEGDGRVVQLLQLDSDMDREGRDFRVLWGDMGVANFFISPQALAARDFSDLFYTWDCS